MNIETAYHNAHELIAKIGCLLDDAEHEIGLDEYARAETTLAQLIDQADILHNVLQLIQARLSHRYSCDENNDDNIDRMVGLDDTCRNLAEHALITKQELENHFNKHTTLFDKIVFAPTYNIKFSTADNSPLIIHEATLNSDSSGRIYFLLKNTNRDKSPQSKYIFDQLNQSDPIALTIDDILSITTAGYEINLTVLKNLKVENR